MSKDEWKELIHGLPCVLCFLHTGSKVFGVEGHHLESIRDNASDWLMVPLCQEHHRGATGVHGLSRRGFATRYRIDDLSLIGATIQLAAHKNFR